MVVENKFLNRIQKNYFWRGQLNNDSIMIFHCPHVSLNKQCLVLVQNTRWHLTFLATTEIYNASKPKSSWKSSTSSLIFHVISILLVSLKTLILFENYFFKKVVYNIKASLESLRENVRFWSFSGPYFPAFGLNMERCSVSLRVQSECVKKLRIRTLFTQRMWYIL